LPQHLKDTLATHAPVNVYKMVMHSPGLAAGFFVMADAIFQANSLPPHLRELPHDEAEIIAWTDRLLNDHTLRGSERGRALEVLSVAQLADLVITVGFYQLVCNFLNTLEVTTDGEPTLG
jgi:4-carboxymuconolactone decarboxylase